MSHELSDAEANNREAWRRYMDALTRSAGLPKWSTQAEWNRLTRRTRREWRAAFAHVETVRAELASKEATIVG